MKKYLSFALALVMIIVLTACAQQEASIVNGGVTSTPSTTTQSDVSTSQTTATVLQTTLPTSTPSPTPEPTPIPRESYDTGITFDNLARNPNNYIGSLVMFSGTVLQVNELTGEIQLRFAINGDSNQVVYVYFVDSLVSERILDNDILTVYGEGKGLHTYTTILGASVTLPLISANIIDTGVSGTVSAGGGSVNAGSSVDNTFADYLSDNYIELTNAEVEGKNADYLDTAFSIVGTASLANYFNYGYNNDIESEYFSISIRPSSGKSWYVYAKRTEFADLFNKLKNGNMMVSFVCYIDSARFNKNQREMATLDFAHYQDRGESYANNITTPQNSFGQYIVDNKIELRAIDVQYDMANNVGKLFSIEGTASLNDYYNYGYNSDIIGSYFCFDVKPNNGGDWYIYADRTQYDSLFNTLLVGSTSISAVCAIDPNYYKSGQNPMASLNYVEFTMKTYSYTIIGGASYKQYIADNLVELSSAQVLFDTTNQVGKNFMLEGTAQIADYYNYGYRDTEAQYFCMNVTASDSSGDWYIYCDRTTFSALFDALKNGNVSVSTVCYIDSATYKAGQGEMATLRYVE